MSIFYKLYQNKRKGSVTKDKWYARSAVMGKTVSLEDLAEHMSQHNTPYSEGVIKGGAHRHDHLYPRAGA